MEDVVVRRRVGLMAAVAIVATVVAALYLWRFAGTHAGIDLVLGLVLGTVAVVHGLAFGDARTPLLVADSTGVRVRLGGGWSGIPWESVERVEVKRRGRVRDGHIRLVADAEVVLSTSGRRARAAARLNRLLYGAPLVTPYGLSTLVSVVDVAASMTRLADGRAEVTEAEQEPGETAATVELTTGTATQHQALHEPDLSGGPLVPASQATPRAATLERAVSGLRSRARRAEVTMPVHRQPAADGTLALSSEQQTEPLPELAQLRRRDDHEADRGAYGLDSGDADRPPEGNIALIIDATTDLSARAMRKVRQSGSAPTAPGVSEPDGSSDDLLQERARDDAQAEQSLEPAGLVIGHQLVQARTRLGLTVDELADRTRIRPYVIDHIEVDDFAPCGGDFYARGHLRMLARVLGLEADPLLTTYDEQFAVSPVNPRQVFEVERASGTSGIVRGSASGSSWGALIAAVLVLLLMWGVARYFTHDPHVVPNSFPQAQTSAGLGSTGIGSELNATPVDTQVKVRAVGGSSQVVVRDASGKTLFRGRLTDGHAKAVVGVAPLQVTVGNGGVIRLTAHGRHLGLMGSSGVAAHATVRAARTPSSTH
ncbi:MAG: helix-turn-helix domain-containing protein [Nocardioidaceae bacterium]